MKTLIFQSCLLYIPTKEVLHFIAVLPAIQLKFKLYNSSSFHHFKMASPSSHKGTEYHHIPEEIVESILSYLPLKEAACLSILSKRFVNSWKFSRNLSFTKEIASKFSKEEFVKFIHDFFLKFSDTNMYRFCLYLDPTSQMDLVQYWVQKAIRSGITELDLDFTQSEQTHMLSFVLSNIEKLRILKLNKCELDLIAKPQVFCLLQQIKLQNVSVPTYSSQVIFFVCLKLTTLEFINCNILYNLKIYAQNLKWFTVLVVKNCTGILTIRIRAPSLHTLHYHGKICEFKFESRLPFLSDVVFEITSPRSFQLLPHRNDVMITLSRVTRLAVNHTILEV